LGQILIPLAAAVNSERVPAHQQQRSGTDQQQRCNDRRLPKETLHWVSRNLMHISFTSQGASLTLLRSVTDNSANFSVKQKSVTPAGVPVI